MLGMRLNKKVDLSKENLGELGRVLEHLPKSCTCSACEKTKETAKLQLGEKKFKMVVSRYGITV